MSLADYGWDDRYEEVFAGLGATTLKPARVLRAAAKIFRVHGDQLDLQATVAGRLRHGARSNSDLPTVGDWVVVSRTDTDEARIEAVLPRHSALSRKVAGKRMTEQVVAANVDLVIVVMALDGDFNLRRLERYLTAVSESGAEPLVLLNKIDLCEQVEARLKEVESIAGGAPVLLASCTSDEGVEAIRSRIEPGNTAVLVGSSGVGKSTLINCLLGEAVQPTRGVREFDQRGRHTTTHRELFRIPGGGLLIDSPGIRELQLWGGQRSLSQSFDDIDGLAGGCRFRDCAHDSESGCAVLAAIEAGKLDRERLFSYRTLQKELRHLETRRNETSQRAQKQKMREIHQELRRLTKKRGR